MDEVKNTLKRLTLYYILLAVVCIPVSELLPDLFPVRGISSIFLLILSFSLLFYYVHRVARKGGLKKMMTGIACMIILFITLRGIKYTILPQDSILARYAWYCYYIPILIIPLLLFYISIYVNRPEDSPLPKKWLWTAAVTGILILFILTNDFHQLCFCFYPDFADWNSDYSPGWILIAANVWEYSLYLAAIVILIIKCRISSSRSHAWLILIPLATGVILLILIMNGSMPRPFGSTIIQFPEALCFMAAGILECCIQLGLIPTNESYGRLMQLSSVAAMITDRNGHPVYVSDSAGQLTLKQFEDCNNTLIDGNTLLHKMEIPGGFGFWKTDITELNRLNITLAETNEQLSEEAELLRNKNNLKEKKAKIEHRTDIYNNISSRTSSQLQLISGTAQMALESEDSAFKDKSRQFILLLSSYIKRYANLVLLAEENDHINVGELGLSIAEFLHYLNIYGIPGEILNNASGTIACTAALEAFRFFEALLEMNLSVLAGVYVNLSVEENHVLLKLTLENLNLPLEKKFREELLAAGTEIEMEYEENITYICLKMQQVKSL